MERAVPILPADDLSVARKFYETLGFHTTFEATADGRSGIMGVERGGIALTIDAPMSGPPR
jgi:predicted lactoylglutathione lyase